ncbi:MAG: peptide chain release factor-like protein [Bacteroidales bacterium]|nr:peptide chain release factor-like protein [Bacteroidales bacterium]
MSSHHQPPTGNRSVYAALSEAELLAQCAVDTYRASGPGGQKRNKTSSAVRLRHLPTGLIVIAEESRSQHENKAKALKRLRRALFLELRLPVPMGSVAEVDAIPTHPDCVAARGRAGRLDVSPRQEQFWPTAGFVLDLLQAVEAQVSTAADLLGISTANLVEFLQSDPKLWQATNQMRTRFGQKPLK